MDQVSQKRLDEILRKEAAALSPGDIEFLRARQSYLMATDLERYAEVLELSTTPEEAPKASRKKKDAEE